MIRSKSLLKGFIGFSFLFSILATANECFAALQKYRPEILQIVRDRITETKAKGIVPVVLFDLDETVINSRTRTVRIFQHLARNPWLALHFRKETEALAEKLQGSDRTLHPLIQTYILYPEKILDTDLGISNQDFLTSVKDPYLDAYLSDSFCSDDIEMPGASSYVRSLHELGAHIVYITGRNGPGMGTCTTTALKKNGFPLDERVTLLMKPNRKMDDADYKRQAMTRISDLGIVVGGFENEPANINTFKAAFPGGVYGFIDVMHSNRPDVPFEGAYWIQSFLTVRELGKDEGNRLRSFSYGNGGILYYCGKHDGDNSHNLNFFGECGSFYKADLRNADLRGLNLRGAEFQNVDLEGADFTGADLNHAKFFNSNLKNAKMDYLNARIFVNGCNFSGTDLTGTTIHSTAIYDSNFRTAILTKTNFIEVGFGGNNFSGVDFTLLGELKNVRFASDDLSHANLNRPRWDGVTFEYYVKFTQPRMNRGEKYGEIPEDPYLGTE